MKSKHPSVASVQTLKPLELLHIDLMGPARIQSLGGKKYILVVMDDFTRYTWVVLLKDKVESLEKMIHLCKKLEVSMEENLRIPSWLPSAMIKACIKSSHHLRHHNKME